MAQLDVNYEDIPSSDFDEIPVGEYLGMVTESDLKENKNKNGNVLSLKIQIVQGDLMNRTMFCNLNIRHSNPVAERIAQQQLKSLTQAVGLASATDSVQLHDKLFMFTVAKRKDGDGTEIKKFKGTTTAPQPSQSPSRSETVPPGSKPPWA